MSFGLMNFNPNGVSTLDLSVSLTKVLGIVSTGTAGGSRTDSNLSKGIPWFVATPNKDLQSFNYKTFDAPDITTSGNGISWSSCPIAHLLIYGIR